MTREDLFARSDLFQKRERPSAMPLPTTSPAGDSVRSLHLSDFDLRFDRYRLIQPKADLLMARSLAKYDQLAPVVYCQLEGSLVHEDGLPQIEVAQMLGRHKSWVNRRLALIQRLTDQAREALRLGLLSPTPAPKSKRNSS